MEGAVGTGAVEMALEVEDGEVGGGGGGGG